MNDQTAATLGPRDPRAADLRRRIFNAIPAAQYAFDTLLRLFDVVVTDAVPSAAVRCGVAPSLLVNPDFVEQWCRRDESLFVLVMHELHHVLLGHTRLFQRTGTAENFAFDAVVNAYLANLFPEEVGRSLLFEIYSATRAPEFLLRPPPGWPGRPDWSAAPAAGVPRALCDLHRRLYAESSVTYEEIFHELVQAGLADAGVLLLGEHGEGAADAPMADGSTLMAAIRAIVERWPQPLDVRRGRGLHDAVVASVVPRVPRPTAAERAVRRAFRAAAVGRAGPLTRRRAAEPTRRGTVLPDPRNRRATVAAAFGWEPLLYRTARRRPRRGEGGRVHLYLDVSGSIEGFLPAIYAALRPCRPWLFPRVHLFSTNLQEVGLAALARGDRLSDGGTDIGPVLHHILDRRVGRALVVTDGHVGRPAPETAALLRARGVRLVVLLTADGAEHDMQDVAAQFERLPPLSFGLERA